MSGVSKSALKGMNRATRLLCQYGEEALKPMKVNDRWRPPMLNARARAFIRKTSIVDGTYGHFDRKTGKGWDAKWDKLEIVSGFSMRPPKLHQNQRNREDRARRVEALVSDMDQKINDYRKELNDSKPEPGIMSTYNRYMKKK
mmetsp:Transcript_11041/g.14425  ORF Transcript_11041/g.14425 Transcript_11041/m.14425 type:complete len:143 (+) Transcript_11041:113-541(+)